MPKLDDFEGAWRLERRIDDRLGRPARYRGRATFRRDGSALVYDEAGWLDPVEGPPLRATRRYRWTGGPLVAVAFSDGRPFHTFDLSRPRPEARHLCGADLYAVRYDFTLWPAWTAAWRVTGPRKDLTLTSRYLPLDACAGGGGRAEPQATDARE